jgi:hypothetical protein
MTILVLAADDKPGMLVNASPALIFGGSIGLILLAVVLLIVAHKLGKSEHSDAPEIINFFGWALGVCGLLGVLYGIFGSSLFS